MAKVISFLFIFAFLSAKTIETSRIENVIPYLDENAWVLIDETLSEIQIGHAGAALALTARAPPISVATLKQLAYIGIHFIFTAPECPKLEIQSPVHWEDGFLFLMDFNRKDEIFRKCLDYCHIYPKKIILIDDRKENLVQMGNLSE